MMISNIEVKNFKTFKDVSLDFNDNNILIGSCASGKSNFIELFDFLKDFSQNFDNAYLSHGGIYLKNLNIKSQNEPFYLKISFVDKNKSEEYSFRLDNNYLVQFRQFSYEINVNFNEDFYEILSEKTEFNYEVYKTNEEIQYDFLFQNSLFLNNVNGVFTAELGNNDYIFSIEDFIPKILLNITQKNFKLNKTPLINSPLSSIPISWGFIFNNIECYNFNPQFSKSISKNNVNSNLLKYGENLSFILSKIFKNKNDKRKLLNLVKDLLPYVDDLDINQLRDNQLYFSILEQNKSVDIPSFFISDGTINIIALVVALYFDKSKFLFIEEPERNIHPSLLSKVVEMIEEASNFKQIFITSHSPELLKFMDLEKVYFISRDLNGFSNISKPIDNSNIKAFIDEFGIDEVFVDNYLGL